MEKSSLSRHNQPRQSYHEDEADDPLLQKVQTLSAPRRSELFRQQLQSEQSHGGNSIAGMRYKGQGMGLKVQIPKTQSEMTLMTSTQARTTSCINQFAVWKNSFGHTMEGIEERPGSVYQGAQALTMTKEPPRGNTNLSSVATSQDQQSPKWIIDVLTGEMKKSKQKNTSRSRTRAGFSVLTSTKIMYDDGSGSSPLNFGSRGRINSRDRTPIYKLERKPSRESSLSTGSPLMKIMMTSETQNSEAIHHTNAQPCSSSQIVVLPPKTSTATAFQNKVSKAQTILLSRQNSRESQQRGQRVMPMSRNLAMHSTDVAMTKQSNWKHLQNTFKRLHELVDSQREKTDESLSRTRSILSSTKQGIQNEAALLSLSRPDSKESHQANEQNRMRSGQKQKKTAQDDIEKALVRRFKFKQGQNMELVGTKSFPSSKESNSVTRNLSRGASKKNSREGTSDFEIGKIGRKEDPALVMLDSPKAQLSHMEKLMAIKNKIKIDLSDHEIKKEHYHLLSSSLCKPSKELTTASGNLTKTSATIRQNSRCENHRKVTTASSVLHSRDLHQSPNKAAVYNKNIYIDSPSTQLKSTKSASNLQKSLFVERSGKSLPLSRQGRNQKLMAQTSYGQNQTSEQLSLKKRRGSEPRDVYCANGWRDKSASKSQLHASENIHPSGAASYLKPNPDKSYVLDIKLCLSKAKKKLGKADKVLSERLLSQKNGQKNLKQQAGLKSELQLPKSQNLNTVHDLSCRVVQASKLGSMNRRDPAYREWISSKIKSIKSEHNLDVSLGDDAFVEYYLLNIDSQNSSQKVDEMASAKTLLGPGYYNVSHESQDRSIPGFRFDQELTSVLQQQNLSYYVREAKQINRDKRTRQQIQKKREGNQPDVYYNSKEALLNEMVCILDESGQVERGDAQLLIKRICDQSKHPASLIKQKVSAKNTSRSQNKKEEVQVPKKVAKKSTTAMSKVPRWGPMSFEEQIDIDMVLNRVKDMNAPPVLKNFISENIKKASSKPVKERHNAPEQQFEYSGSEKSPPASPVHSQALLSHKLKVDERRDEHRADLVQKMVAKEDRRQQALRLGHHQQEVQESVLELFTLNAFLHSVADTYLTRYGLQHQKQVFSRRAVVLFWVIGKFKLKAKSIKIKLADSKAKQTILKWVKRWRAKRHALIQERILDFMEERQSKVSALLRTAQRVYCSVVCIQRVVRRFLRRKKYIMCIYSMSWIMAEKRYLAQLKKSEQTAKEKIAIMSSAELFQIQQTVVPLKVRLFYVTQYYDMARQAFKKQHLQWCAKALQQQKDSRLSLLHRAQTSALIALESRSQANLTQQILAGENAPLFQSSIIKTDLVQMIIDALRFRIKWQDIEKGQFFHSPALKRISKLWYERTGLRYVSAEMEEQNKKVVAVKVRKAEKLHGRIRRTAILQGDIPLDQIAKFAQAKNISMGSGVRKSSSRQNN